MSVRSDGVEQLLIPDHSPLAIMATCNDLAPGSRHCRQRVTRILSLVEQGMRHRHWHPSLNGQARDVLGTLGDGSGESGTRSDQRARDPTLGMPAWARAVAIACKLSSDVGSTLIIFLSEKGHLGCKPGDYGG